MQGTGRLGRVTRKDVEAFLNIETIIPKDLVDRGIVRQAMDPIRKNHCTEYGPKRGRYT